jgi:hypothetical protein
MDKDCAEASKIEGFKRQAFTMVLVRSTRPRERTIFDRMRWLFCCLGCPRRPTTPPAPTVGERADPHFIIPDTRPEAEKAAALAQHTEGSRGWFEEHMRQRGYVGYQCE